ncbi:hypothetical protein BGZ99_000873, partial [Dissophora globulifera]
MAPPASITRCLVAMFAKSKKLVALLVVLAVATVNVNAAAEWCNCADHFSSRAALKVSKAHLEDITAAGL